MLKAFWKFWRDDDRPATTPTGQPLPPSSPPQRRRNDYGQSVVEYAILLAWLSLASIGMIRGVNNATKAIWATTNTTLNSAANVSGS